MCEWVQVGERELVCVQRQIPKLFLQRSAHELNSYLDKSAQLVFGSVTTPVWRALASNEADGVYL